MSNIFRDRTEGATARRQDLLRRRRDELVTMPHAIRRVYVARRARIAASIAVCLAGAGLVTAASSAKLSGWLATGMPGLNPAVLSTLVIVMWVVGIVVYMAARAKDEHRFAVEMSRYVMPGNDLDDDLERLTHEHPDEAAREMAHRLEVRSAALPVVAAAFVLPATIMYIVHAIHVRGWPAIADFEANLAEVSRALVAIAILGLVSGIVMTRRIARVPRVAYVAGGIAVITGVLAVALFLDGRKPMSWWLAAPSMILLAVGAIAHRLRIERELLEAKDPAAGSEMFTWRGLVRGIRQTFTAISDTLTLANAKRFVCAVGVRSVRGPSAAFS